MNYPIFNAIVNQLETRLSKRSIQVDQFRLWKEEKINATGLEIGMDLSSRSPLVERLIIHLDWDKFREAGLARQLPGLQKHPLLNDGFFSDKGLSPYIDAEIIWSFREEPLYEKLHSTVGNRRMEAAKQWMDVINREIKSAFAGEDLITRWHVDIEGDLNGRYVTNMSLISYMQYELDAFSTLNDIHLFMEQNMQRIVLKTDSIIKIASKTLEMAA